MGGQYIRIIGGGNNLPLSGGTGGPYTFTGGTYANGNLSATTIYSGSTDLSDLFGAGLTGDYLPLSGGTGGPYTFTGGTYNEGSLTATTDLHVGRRVSFDTPFSASMTGGSYNINLSNGSIQKFFVQADTTITYSNALPGTYLFLFENDASGTQSVVLSGSSGWYTSGGNQPPYGNLANNLNIWTGIYDGDKMWITSTRNFEEI